MASVSRISERFAVIGTIDPDAIGASTVVTDEINMANFKRVLFVVMAGTLGASATVDFTVYGGASSNAGSHATEITGKAITQLTQAGSDSDKQVLVEVTAEEVAAQSLQYIEGSLTIATATSDAGVLVIGEPADYSNVTTLDLSTVDEIVT